MDAALVVFSLASLVGSDLVRLRPLLLLLSLRCCSLQDEGARKRLKRKQSNRESARRSRLKKQVRGSWRTPLVPRSCPHAQL